MFRIRHKATYRCIRSPADGIAIIVQSKRNRLTLLETAHLRGLANHIYIQSMPPDEKTWIDNRPGSQKGRNPAVLTEGAIMQAMREMASNDHPPRYIYRTSARANGKPLLYLMEYFKGSGVVVQDGDGNMWLNGKAYQNIK